LRIPLVDLKAQLARIRPEVNGAMERVLEGGQFILGREVEDFENAFANFVGTKQSVGVASGTAALRLALQACGIGPGDEVITVAHTFFATGEAISQLGARPIFVDIDPRSYNIDPNQVGDVLRERRSHPRSRGNGAIKAILPVHLYGQSADMDSLLDLADQHGLAVIEDAAQAHGAEYRGRPCGGMGRLGCFSFYPGKNLGAFGDAGAITGNDEALMARVRSLRDHGRKTKYEHDEIGASERMDSLQAAILGVKLSHLEAWNDARRALAGLYDRLLGAGSLELPYTAAECRHVYHLYVIRTARRDEIRRRLHNQGIGSGIHYPIPLHRQPAYSRLGYDRQSLPVTERLVDEIVSLPMYPELEEDQAAEIACVVREVTN
jgi:dTDP-4-amino-4,6-dideoxygalactose transaminase